MKTNPYFIKEERHITGSVTHQLYYHTGEGAELIFTYHQEHLAIAAERIANDAHNRGVLRTLRAQKHRLNMENQRLHELIEDLDS